jgi:hypothetical protein
MLPQPQWSSAKHVDWLLSLAQAEWGRRVESDQVEWFIRLKIPGKAQNSRIINWGRTSWIRCRGQLARLTPIPSSQAWARGEDTQSLCATAAARTN